MARVAAVDLGATSGRVCVVEVGSDTLTIEEVARFPNGPVTSPEGLTWPFESLVAGVRDGLARAQHQPLDGVGVDSWAVDYGRLDESGTLLANPFSYRDSRTTDALDEVRSAGRLAEWWRLTGITPQPFNTVFQLRDDVRQGRLLSRVALIPDLVNHYLSGVDACEITNASTTGLLGLDGQWVESIFDGIGVSPGVFGPLVEPGTVLGRAREPIPGVPVIAVASHDTASAVLAVPAHTSAFAFISCGTWSLVGMESERPYTSEPARLAGFTNERGVDGTTRFLHNVMGLWVLNECRREWARAGLDLSTAELGERAGRLERGSVIDINDPSLFAPGDMIERVTALCRASEQREPTSPVEVARVIFDSLAAAYAAAVERLEGLTGESVEVVHLVGGGSRSNLLAQLTANACGRDVVAGPSEAAVIGNALIQAAALGELDGDRWAWRALVARQPEIRRFHPFSG